METNIEIKVEQDFLQELTLLKKLKVPMIMCQRKRAPVHAVRIGLVGIILL